jgi:hypothetical protein
MKYKVHVKTIGHEVYEVEADSSLLAEEVFNEGSAGEPISEMLDAEVTCVEAVDE